MGELKTTPSFARLVRSIPVAIVCILILILAPAGPGSAKPRFPDNDDNGLVICVPVRPRPLDPTDHRSRLVQIVLKNIFDSLTVRDARMNVVPQLAESWRAVSETRWEFKLRPGVKFHNGEPLTADDVKFTLDRVAMEGGLDGRTSPRRSLFKPICRVEAVDSRTVVISTDKPWPVLPLMLSLQEIVPRKYMTEVGSKGFRNHPVGCGPFRFIAIEGGKRIILKRFDDYYGGSPEIPPVQPARLDYLVFQTTGSGAEQIALLKKGEADLIFDLPTEAIPILRATPGIKVLSSRATRSYFAEINCLKPPWNDPSVRRALNYGLDKQVVLRNILKGCGVILPTVLLPEAFAYAPDLTPYPYRPDLASGILTKAGLSGKDPVNVSIHCVQAYRSLAETIAMFLAKLGLKPNMVIEPGFRPRSLGPQADWDIFIGSWGNYTLDPIGILPPKFASRASGNFSGYGNTEVDRLFALAEGTMDRQARKNYYQAAQRIIYRDAPMIFGYAADELYGVRDRVKNFKPLPGGMIVMHDVYVK